MTKIETQEVKKLNANDRCDQCVSQAYVSVTGITGELMFCGHHYNKITKDEKAYEKLAAFAFVVTDERKNLYDKRAGQ